MKLGDLASRLGLQLRGDPGLEISGPAPLEVAGPGSVTFVGHPKYARLLEGLRAACVMVTPELATRVKGACLISANPYFDFARAMEVLLPPYHPPPGIHPSAQVAPDAAIGEQASIGAYCVIGAGVTIGTGATIHPHVTIYPGVRVGDDFICHSQVSIRDNVTIGNRVVVHNGAVIGADGFGYVEHGGALVKIPQVGGVVIEDDVELGANVTIDRAAMGATVIRRGVKLDDLVHIGHNCEVGAHSILSAQAGVSGSVKIGEWCAFGGQVGLADHLTIGNRVRVAAQSGVPNDVADDLAVGGYPAIEMRRWRRMVAAAPRLPELLRRVRALEQRLGLITE